MREQFPFFINNPDTVYLDTAATTLSPDVLIKSLSNSLAERVNAESMSTLGSNIRMYIEDTRNKLRNYLNISEEYSVIWTPSATYSANILASNIPSNSIVAISDTEHNASYIPLFAKDYTILNWSKGFENVRKNLKELKVLDFVFLPHVSNVTGQLIDLRLAIEMIKEHFPNAKIYIDGSQALSCHKPNLHGINFDAYYASSHKMYGPDGLGFLIVKALPTPLITGGRMIEQVQDNIIYKQGVAGIEAGSPPASLILSFGAVIEWLNNLSEQVYKDIDITAEYLYDQLSTINNIKIYSEHRSKIISFNIMNVDALDLGYYLESHNIIVRSGQHCALLIHKELGISSSVRVSLGIYSTKDDVDILINNINNFLRIIQD
jgi:selenocysteine lyase/cysteine desulfurase